MQDLLDISYINFTVSGISNWRTSLSAMMENQKLEVFIQKLQDLGNEQCQHFLKKKKKNQFPPID